MARWPMESVALVLSLPCLVSLDVLMVDGSIVTKEEAEILARALSNCTSLRKLGVSLRFVYGGEQPLIDTLSTHPSITSLFAAFDFWSDSESTLKALAGVASILSRNTQLRELVFHKIPCHEATISQLAEGIKTNTTLRRLAISMNTGENMSHRISILKALGENKGLLAFHFRSVLCGEEIEALASSLSRHPSLLNIDVGCEGARDLINSNNAVFLSHTHHRRCSGNCQASISGPVKRNAKREDRQA